MWALIGGSGFEKFDEVELLEELDRETPFGTCSSGLKKIGLDGREALFLPRHGSQHELLPHEINYRANIYALKKHGASKILSISAVGSLRQELAPGDLVVPTQYINCTRSLRDHTFCGQGIVGHPSLADPVQKELVDCVNQVIPELNYTVHLKKSYVCIEGPHFSSRAESLSYRQMQADIIGMTNYPEYALAREAALGYLPCCFVTDYDSWDDAIPHVTLEEVLKIMRGNNRKALDLARQLLARFPDVLPKGCPHRGLANCLMTPWDRIPDEKKGWLSVLLGQENINA